MDPIKNSLEQKKTEDQEIISNLNDAILLLRYLRHSVRRHGILVIATFFATIGAGIVFLAITPNVYEVTTRILTYQSNIIPELATPDGRARGATTPRGMSASELIKSRENLIGVIADTNLIQHWKEQRTWIGRIKDRIRTFLVGPLTEKDYQAALLEMLEDRFWVNIDDNVIVITVNWFDPNTTFALADGFSNRFLAEQQTRELAEYNETLRILDKKVKESKKYLNAALELYVSQNKQIAQVTPEKRVRTPGRVVEAAETVDDEKIRVASVKIDKMKIELSLKHQEIDRLESTYEQRLTDAKNELDSLQTNLGPKHPDVIKASRYLRMLSVPPSGIAERKAEEAMLARKIEDAGGAVAPTESNEPLRRKRVKTHRSESVVAASEQGSDEGTDEVAFEAYRKAEINYNTQSERLENARMELEAAEAAFAYRFMITKPPVFPKRPVTPDPKKNILASIFTGLILGIFLAVLVDIRSGLITESWQVSKILKVRVLGEIDEH